MISIDLSNKLKVVSLMFILLVIYLHSYNIKVNYSEESIIVHDSFNYLFQGLFSQGITRIAVPYFFLISGYLYYYTLNPSISGFIEKYKSRFISLLIPYFLWFLLGFSFFGILKELSLFDSFVSTTRQQYWSIESFFTQLFYGNIQYHFWFLRHLIVYVILSPVIYLLLRYLKEVFVIGLLIFWLCHSTKYAFIHSEGLFFYSLGGFLAVHRKQYRDLLNVVLIKCRKYSELIVLVWIFLIAIKISLCYSYQIVFPTVEFELLSQSAILMGMVGIWVHFEKVPLFRHGIVLHIANYTFFIYALHEPLLLITKKLSLFLLPHVPITFTLVYIMAPLIVIVVVMTLAKILERWLTYIYSLLIGGRV